MSITTKPEPIIRRDGDCEETATPVAFRASSRHPWRTYEVGNPQYDFDLNAFHSMERIGGADVLCAVTRRWLGREYETRCNGCGAYLIIQLPSNWEPAPVDALCGACIGKSNDGQPQDGMRPYTPEFQRSYSAGEKR